MLEPKVIRAARIREELKAKSQGSKKTKIVKPTKSKIRLKVSHR
jgi:hypothetical protein